ncbi:hypothetical protein Lfu02_28090 [Longispora fulva]|nr:hypothetical protein Lfu02_28090 [Longispora fulva]
MIEKVTPLWTDASGRRRTVLAPTRPIMHTHPYVCLSWRGGQYIEAGHLKGPSHDNEPCPPHPNVGT